MSRESVNDLRDRILAIDRRRHPKRYSRLMEELFLRALDIVFPNRPRT